MPIDSKWFAKRVMRSSSSAYVNLTSLVMSAGSLGIASAMTSIRSPSWMERGYVLWAMEFSLLLHEAVEHVGEAILLVWSNRHVFV